VTREHVPVALQRRVRQRAEDRCEYCRFAQAGQEATFHIDHIVPRREGGATTFDNLALACVSCSLRKAARTSAADPSTGDIVPLYHPRVERWPEHFTTTTSFLIRGRTPTGRATIDALQMNRLLAIAIRREEATRGRFP
jgi:hypothetical protein